MSAPLTRPPFASPPDEPPGRAWLSLLKPGLWGGLGLVLLVGLGFMGMFWRAHTADRRLREYLIDQANAIADALPRSQLYDLSFNSSDRQSPVFQEIETHLATYAKAHSLHSIYGPQTGGCTGLRPRKSPDHGSPGIPSRNLL